MLNMNEYKECILLYTYADTIDGQNVAVKVFSPGPGDDLKYQFQAMEYIKKYV